MLTLAPNPSTTNVASLALDDESLDRLFREARTHIPRGSFRETRGSASMTRAGSRNVAFATQK
jgi:hypothetical protein